MHQHLRIESAKLGFAALQAPKPAPVSTLRGRLRVVMTPSAFMDDFDIWFAFCMAPGNDGRADDTCPGDGGGVTRWGWTYPTWQAATCYAGGADRSEATFRALSQIQARALARRFFWQRLGGETLAAGADVSIIDFRWTSGGAIAEIQKGLGHLEVDGVIGPETIAAVNATDPCAFIQDCHDWRIRYYDHLGYQHRYPGLYVRADGVLDIARGLIPCHF